MKIYQGVFLKSFILFWALYSLFAISGCGGIGAAVLGSGLGLAGDRGLNYYESGETGQILYTDFDSIETSVVKTLKKYDYALITAYSHEDGTMEYEAIQGLIDVRAPEDEKIKVVILVKPIADDINEVTVSARKGLVAPEQAVCHLLMRDISEAVK